MREISVLFYLSGEEELKREEYRRELAARALSLTPDLLWINLEGEGGDSESYEEILDVLGYLAADAGCCVLAGVLLKGGGKQREKYGVLLDAGGSVIGTVHKKDDAEGLSHAEEFGVFETSFGKIGLALDMDLFSVEIPRILALKGAELLFVLDRGGPMVRNGMDYVRGIAVYHCMDILYARAKEGKLCIVMTTPLEEVYRGELVNGETKTIDAVLIRELREPDLSFKNTLWWLLWGRKPQYYKELLQDWEE